MADYLYNGARLPALPEWDRVVYPYAVIEYATEVLADDGILARLVCFSSPFPFRAIGREMGYLVTGDVLIYGYANYSDIWYWSFGTDGTEALNEWVNIGTRHYDEETVVGEQISTARTIWSNYDLYFTDDTTNVEPGALYLAASDPVPVTTPEPLDPTSLLMGWLVGRQIAGQRGKKVEQPKELIPAGGTYYIGVTSTTLGDYTGATTVLSEGDEFPETVSSGDIYVYGDYAYRYNYRKYSLTKWAVDDSSGGWGVFPIDSTKSTYESPLFWIAGLPLKNMRGMFYNCSSLQSLDVSNWDTSNVTNMRAMFSGCSCLTSLDASNWDTSNVTSMKSMFYKCVVLTSLDVSNWNTSNVEDMSYIFQGCTALTSLDVSNWDTSKVANMKSMFYNCTKLSELNLSGWNTSNVTSMEYMFYDCTALTSLDVSNWDTSNVTNMYAMFYSCEKLSELDLSGWNTSNVTSMQAMFDNCFSLQSLDVSNWDTSNVTTMLGMFYDCSALASLDASNWDTSNVTSMKNMFRNCSSLQSLDVSNWNPSNVTTMLGMFYDCSALASLDVSNWDTSNVTNMYAMFYICEKLSELDLSGWNTSKVNDMRFMFEGCTAMRVIYVGEKWVVPSTNIDSMFARCGVSSVTVKS